MAGGGPTLVAKQGVASSWVVSHGVAEGMSALSSDAGDGVDVPTAFGTGRGVGASGTLDAPAWLQPILRLLVETQHELATKGGSTKPRTALAALRLEEFRGRSEVTTHQYRAWKKQTQIIQRLYGLKYSKVAFIIYNQVKGRTKTALGDFGSHGLGTANRFGDGLEDSGPST